MWNNKKRQFATIPIVRIRINCYRLILYFGLSSLLSAPDADRFGLDNPYLSWEREGCLVWRTEACLSAPARDPQGHMGCGGQGRGFQPRQELAQEKAFSGRVRDLWKTVWGSDGQSVKANTGRLGRLSSLQCGPSPLTGPGCSGWGPRRPGLPDSGASCRLGEVGSSARRTVTWVRV